MRAAVRQGLSERQFAAQAGLSYQVVRYAKRRGRLVLFPDGSIDPEPSLERIRTETNSARSAAGRLGGRSRARRAAAASTATTNGSRPAATATPEHLPQAIEPATVQLERLPDAIASTLDQIRRAAGHLDYEAAQTLVALLRAYTAQLQAARARGELVERQAVERIVTAQATAERNSWLAWPSRVAALMAAEIGADAGRVQAALERHVRQHLTELGSAELDLSQLAQGRR